MKRFIIIMTSLFLIAVTGFYLYYVEGYYIGFSKASSISTPFYVEKNVIYHHHDKESQPFIIKGIEVDSSYGPNRGTDFTIVEQTWLRWFKLIQQAGANTIRTSTVLSDQFYNALYEYNMNSEQPLYLLQGIQVTTDQMILKTKNYKNPEFYQSLIKDGKDIVDIIHGRKILIANEHKGNGIYRKNISPWVIGYLIGDEWNQDSIAFINQTLEHDSEFKGDYVTTTSEATNFEMMIARIIEQIVSFESKKYHTQRLVSVNSSFIMDPFQYEEHYAAQLGKFNTFMMEHIKPTSKMKSGLFASYAYEELEYSILPMIEDKEKSLYSDISNYYELLYQAHELPVIISSVGYPSTSYLNHKYKQETILLDDLRRFDSIGYNGTVIRSWQDVWDRRALGTSFSVDLQQINEWHDPLTSTQHFGLLGFKPYRDEELMEVDGKRDDWQDVSAVFRDEIRKVSMTRDHAYLYFWLEDPIITDQKPFYLALDLNPKLGSKTPNLIDAGFDRDMDFVIKVDPSQGANVYVQNRYQGVRGNFLEDVTGENPFAAYPRKSSDIFEPVKHVKDNKKILTEEEIDDPSTKYYRYSFDAVDKLVLSNDNQTQGADVAVNDGYLEIRLPYQLLNVYNPLTFTVHDDYYEHFGVEPLEIDYIYLSIASNRQMETQSIEIPVKPLHSLKRVEEYLKPAYYAVKSYWKAGN